MIRRTGLLALGGAVLLLLFALVRREPGVLSFQTVRAAHHASDMRLLDRHGELLHELRTDETGRRLAWTALADISPALQTAVIISEDRRFYTHRGVDGWALAAAATRWITGGPRRGASTISMQLAALLNAGLSQRGRPRTVEQKWRQIRVAKAIERHWSKAEILEAYLNLVTFRGEIQGVSAAAALLFGKAPHGVTEAEALVLAALLRAPNAVQSAVARRAWRLQETAGDRINQQELDAVVAQALDAPHGLGLRVALAPHVARTLLRPVTATSQEGETVRSTLDGAVQRVSLQALRHHLLAARGRHVQDGAVLVVDNATGDVLAYVGGSDDLSTAPYVDGIRARRQAGSSLKPFLYGVALEQRLLTAASLLDDTPLDLSVTGGLFRPRNYDEQFGGLVTVRTALAGSVNVPAVRTLDLVGVEVFVQQLRRLGFEGLTESGEYYGPSLALGSADVSLWELVNAYRTLANGGVWSPLRIRAGEREAKARRRLYSEATAFLLSDILADRESRSATFGLESPLATRFWSAVKTGTSKEMRDNWCVGYSRHYTVGVWVGNFSGEPMRDVSGVTGAAPIWFEIISWLHRSLPSRPPAPPRGLLARAVKWPGRVEPSRGEWFLEGTEPTTTAQALAAGHPRIITPVHDMVIALDPDIPPSQQRVVFEAHGDGGALRWMLNGTDLGSAAELLIWDPHPGRHTLSLVDEQARLLDTVAFEVRGNLLTGGE